MDQYQAETELSMSRDFSEIEDAFNAVSQKIQDAANLIVQLRTDKRTLIERINSVQAELTALRTDIHSKEQELKRVKAEHLQLLNSHSENVFSEEEKENLKNKIRDLIAKINSYL